MENEFVPYKQSLELKELGFDEPCLGFYWNTGKFYITAEYHNYVGLHRQNQLGDYNYDSTSSPTFSQSFRWFRDKSKLQAEILWRGDMGCFCYKTGEFKYGSHEFSEDDYNTYEEAELECLKKLIEIVKNK
jgi:hypothetical protein